MGISPDADVKVTSKLEKSSASRDPITYDLYGSTATPGLPTVTTTDFASSSPALVISPEIVLYEPELEISTLFKTGFALFLSSPNINFRCVSRHPVVICHNKCHVCFRRRCNVKSDN